VQIRAEVTSEKLPHDDELSEVVSALRSALATLDSVGMAIPAAHLNQAIELILQENRVQNGPISD